MLNIEDSSSKIRNVLQKISEKNIPCTHEIEVREWRKSISTSFPEDSFLGEKMKIKPTSKMFTFIMVTLLFATSLMAVNPAAAANPNTTE